MLSDELPYTEILRLYNCRAKYKLGNAQTKPPKNADKARSRLTTNNTAVMNNVTSHCHTRIRFICVGIVNFRTKFLTFYSFCF